MPLQNGRDDSSGSDQPGSGGVPAPIAAKLVAAGRRQQARRGQIVLSEGSDSTDVLFVVSGAVQITLFGKRGQVTILRKLGAGHIFGELSAIDGKPRSATVIATEDSVFAFISARQFLDLVHTMPDAGDYLARLLTHRIRSLTERLQELATEPMSYRLIAEIIRCGTPSEDGMSMIVDPLPTHVDLAARIGSQREAVSREMAALRKARLIIRSGRRATIPSVELLLGPLNQNKM